VALRSQELHFQVRTSAEAAYAAGGGNYAVVRQAWLAAVAHEVADRACGAWTSCQCGDVAVGGDASNGNPPHDRQHAP
jgi:hypothetical protein